MTNDSDADDGVMDAADIFGDLDNGLFVPKAEDAIRKVTAAVLRTRKAGTVTLKMAIRWTEDSEVGITADVDYKAPRPSARERNFFASEDGKLAVHDPRQPHFPGMAEEVRPRQRQTEDVKPRERKVELVRHDDDVA